MRKLLLLVMTVFFVSACADMDNMLGGGDNDDGYYGGRSGYGNNGYGNNNYGGGYYPYGNANYPRDRIYVITPYNGCNGYAYEGYCYRDKDDYRNAVIWDQNHQNNANWNKKRKDWCNQHDCRRNHDTRYRTTDAQGRPLEQPVERDGSAKYYPAPKQPVARPAPYYGQSSSERDDDSYRRHSSHSPQYVPPVRNSGSSGDDKAGDFQQTQKSHGKHQRSESYGSQPYQQQPGQPSSSSRSRSQEKQSSSSSDGAYSQPSGKSKSKRGSKSEDMSVTPE